MKKSDKIFARTKESILLIVLLVLCIPKVVYADSSWIWFTTTAPYQLLPFVAVLKIVIEYLMIKNILHIQNKKRVLIAVCISNLVSFMVPYFATYYQDGVYETIKQTFESMDFYTINSAYLFLTLIIECPIVYAIVQDEIHDKKKSLGVIAAANVVTTVMVAAIERIACRGSW